MEENKEKEPLDGPKLISGEILGYNCETIQIAGNFYVLQPPTIARLAGAAYYLSDFNEDFDSVQDILDAMKGAESAAKALSFLIKGDESLSKELMEGTWEEISNGLLKGLMMADISNFARLSSSVRSARRMTVRQST